MPILLREWQSDEEFAAERPHIQGVGGSDAGPAVGLSRYQSAMEWNLRKRGLLPPVEDNEAMEMGRILEPIVLQRFTKTTGLEIVRPRALYRHDRYPWMLANVDAQTVESPRPAIVEAKTGSAYTADAWADDAIPTEYELQGAHYLAVMDLEVCYIPVLLGGQHLEIRRIVRDEELIRNLIELEGEAWQRVLDGVTPEPDGSESAGRALGRLYASADGSTIALPASAADLIDQYEAATAQIKAAETMKEEAKQRLQAMLGGAVRGTVGNRVVRWTPYEQTRVDTEALKRAGLYNQYAKSSSSRRFGLGVA